jgi:VanZ family protein
LTTAAEKGAGRIRILAPIAYMALIFILSSFPGASDSDDFSANQPGTWLSSPIQNALHIPTYGLLAALLWWSLIPRIQSVRIQAVSACLIAAAYGALDELHQALVPGRTSSFSDIVFNFIGVATGAYFFGYVYRAWASTRSGRVSGTPGEPDVAGNS